MGGLTSSEEGIGGGLGGDDGRGQEEGREGICDWFVKRIKHFLVKKQLPLTKNVCPCVLEQGCSHPTERGAVSPAASFYSSKCD